MTELKDSGERDEFGGGAVRDCSAGKGRYDLLSPLAAHRKAVWTEAGAIKYADRNWEKGIPISRFIDSLRRHLAKLLCGLTDEDHAAALDWNAQGIHHTLLAIEMGLLPEALDDRPKYFDDCQEKGLEFFEGEVWVQEMAAEKEAEEDSSEVDTVCATAVACQVAAVRDVDLSSVDGTGPSGCITGTDVMGAAEQRNRRRRPD